MNNNNAISPVIGLKNFLEERSKELQRINNNIDIKKIIIIILREAMANEALLKCKPIYIFNAVSEILELGLEVGSQYGEAYLIPRKDGKCQAMIGYRGLINIAYKNPQIKIIRAHPVYEGDTFEYELGIDIKIKHIPCGNADPTKLTHAYAVIKLENGEIHADVMTRDEIEASRKQSRNVYEDTAWVTFYGEMAKKTVVKRLLKYIPKTKELSKAIYIDNLVSDNLYIDDSDIDDATVDANQPKRTNELINKIKEQREETINKREETINKAEDAPPTAKQEKAIKDFKEKLFNNDSYAFELFLEQNGLPKPDTLENAKKVISQLIKTSKEEIKEILHKADPFINE